MENKYQVPFLDLASKLDAMSASLGEISAMARSVVDSQDSVAVRALLGRIGSLVSAHDMSKEVARVAGSVKECLTSLIGYARIMEICDQGEIEPPERSLAELCDELDHLIGLDRVKIQVKDLIAYQQVQSLRRTAGLRVPRATLHLAFTGGPGTGKTTVARIVGRMYKQLGLLSRGHFLEVSRTDLIAGYQGQTAIKVRQVVERARGGVLFIDEAYSLTENDHSDSYGRECLTELTKALEDYREDLVVIVAGYPAPMEKFFQSNPGLESRFGTFIEFPDYNPEELCEILKSMCTAHDYTLNSEQVQSLQQLFSIKVASGEAHSANARLVRNLFDSMVRRHATRVSKVSDPGRDVLSVFHSDDFGA